MVKYVSDETAPLRDRRILKNKNSNEIKKKKAVKIRNWGFCSSLETSLVISSKKRSKSEKIDLKLSLGNLLFHGIGAFFSRTATKKPPVF